MDDKHVKLSNLTNDAFKAKLNPALAAADKIAEAGGSPRAQIDAAREATHVKLGYKPHFGARQRARALARMKE